MEGILAAVDIGGTKITVSLCGKCGFLVRVYQRTDLEGSNSSIPLQVRSMVNECLERTGHGEENISAMGISTAGPFQYSSKMVELVSPNICGGMNPDLPNDWSSVPLEEVLSSYFKMIRIENDAVSGAIAERMFGAGQGYDDLLYVTWSTGIGTGAFVDGRVIKGKNGNAPHGGHVYVGEGGRICGCGNESDMEASASGTAIADLYGKGVGAEEVFSAYEKGEIKAKRTVENAARYFARGLASINAVLDTRMIIIGGSVFLNNEDMLLPMVKEEFYRSFPALTEDVVFAPSELREYLGDVAALSLVIPDDWTEEWRRSRPWESSPATIFLKNGTRSKAPSITRSPIKSIGLRHRRNKKKEEIEDRRKAIEESRKKKNG
ncbi:MAG: ROK family protein, partial [Thermoplasmatota archaeon]